MPVGAYPFSHFSSFFTLARPGSCQRHARPAQPAQPGPALCLQEPIHFFTLAFFHFRPESGKINQCSGILVLHPCKPVNKLCKCDKSAKSLRVGRFVRIHSKMTNLTSWRDSSLTNLSGWRDSSLRGDMSRISRDMAFVT